MAARQAKTKARLAIAQTMFPDNDELPIETAEQSKGQSKRKQQRQVDTTTSVELANTVQVVAAGSASIPSKRKKTQQVSLDPTCVQSTIRDDHGFKLKMGHVLGGQLQFDVQNFQAYLCTFKQFASEGEVLALFIALLKFIETSKDASTIDILFRKDVTDKTPQIKGAGNWRDLLEANGYNQWIDTQGPSGSKHLSNKARTYFDWTSLDMNSRFPEFSTFLCVFFKVMFTARGMEMTNQGLANKADFYLSEAHPEYTTFTVHLDFGGLGVKASCFPAALAISLVQLPVAGLVPNIDNSSNLYLKMKECTDAFQRHDEAGKNFKEQWRSFLGLANQLNSQLGRLVNSYVEYSSAYDVLRAVGSRLHDSEDESVPDPLLDVQRQAMESSGLEKSVFSYVSHHIASVSTSTSGQADPIDLTTTVPLELSQEASPNLNDETSLSSHETLPEMPHSSGSDNVLAAAASSPARSACSDDLVIDETPAPHNPMPEKVPFIPAVVGGSKGRGRGKGRGASQSQGTREGLRNKF